MKKKTVITYVIGIIILTIVLLSSIEISYQLGIQEGFKEEMTRNPLQPTPNPVVSLPTEMPSISITPAFQLSSTTSSTANNITKTTNNMNIYEDDEIKFTYSPSLFTLEKVIGNTASVSETHQNKEIFTLTNPSYSLTIVLNMWGIGGGCPDFPKGYQLIPFTIDGVTVLKAKNISSPYSSIDDIVFVNQPNANDLWNCPNVAGLHSQKNGSMSISYDLSKLPVGSKEYIQAEMQLDTIIASIKKLWNY